MDNKDGEQTEVVCSCGDRKEAQGVQGPSRRKESEGLRGIPRIILRIAHARVFSVPADIQESIRWYKKAADLGDRLSQCHVGDRYCEQGDQHGNYKAAVEMYMRGAENGYGASEYRMG